MKKSFLLLSLFILATFSLLAQNLSKVWVSDFGNGRYKNPVLYADYPDLDVCRVGDNYYMVSSSFGSEPGLPILQSKDLVNWKLEGYGLRKLSPKEKYIVPQHDRGIQTPSIRHQKGNYYIYYSDPDIGIFMIKTNNIQTGNWDEPVLVLEGKNLISPCPIWENDKTYLMYEYKKGDVGVQNIVILATLNSEGTQVVDEGIVIFDGHGKHAGMEGAKIIKKDGYFYIFASAGDPNTLSWILTLRSKNIEGPYEEQLSMFQAETNFSGLYKGALVDTPSGAESWYLNTQNILQYGTVVMLNPVIWKNGWPQIGGVTQGGKPAKPILNFKKPSIASAEFMTVSDTDNFDGNRIGAQWQWNASSSPYWYFLNRETQQLRLYSQPLANDSAKNLWNSPNMLLQKLPAGDFTMTTKIRLISNQANEGERGGVVVFGQDYATLAIEKDPKGFMLYQTECINADKNNEEIENRKFLIYQDSVYIRVKMTSAEKCTLSYSLDGTVYYAFGKECLIKKADAGVKIGLFCTKPKKSSTSGWIDVDFFEFDK
jgi:beta-xylosidase